jgi:hypothetical protein
LRGGGRKVPGKACLAVARRAKAGYGL